MTKPSRHPETSRGASLAILGGHPCFEEPLHVGRPNIGDRERLMARFGEMLDRRWLTNNGPFVQQFEARLAEHLGVRHCIAMCNATVALEIAIRALGLEGEVIVPSMTFIATAHSLQWQQITPVFCDIDDRTHTIDPGRVEELITPRTTGIIGVHLWGQGCDVDALADIASRRGLRLMFDAAHAFSCTHQGRMIGNFGACEVLSFHATKFFNTLEGGAVVTNDDELARQIRLMKNFGFAGYDNVTYIGTNGKMPETSAATGLTSLESLETFREVNRRNYLAYRSHLADVPGLRTIDYGETELRNYQYIVVEVNEAQTGLARDELIAVLHAENVLARRYFYPGCHRMEPYRSLYPHARFLLPKTEALAERLLILPTGTAVDASAVASIAQIISTAIGRAPQVKAAASRFAAARAA
jgi:dTDP-4-amino-4,6-dideoxygalactose transaminase